LSEDEIGLLERLRVQPPSKEDFHALARLRLRLLLEFAPRPHIRWLPMEHVELDEVLARIRRVLQTRLTRGLEGRDMITVFYLDRLRTSPAEVRQAVLDYSGQVGATVQQAAGHTMSELMDGKMWDTVVIDEASRAMPSDLVVPMVRASRRVVMVGDHKQLPHLIEARLEQAMEEDKAVELGALRESMFQHIYERHQGTKRAVMLDEQFRMHPVIGDLISRVFYEGKLKSPRPAEDFVHNLATFGDVPVAWVDVPEDKGAQRFRGTSLIREVEADAVVDYVTRVVYEGQGFSIGVIAFYKAQAELLRKRLDGLDQVEVGTVDAFQGREFDVVFLSVVRARGGFGFLRMENRLNVAMSRAKRLLVSVGALDFYSSDKAKEEVWGLYELAELCRKDGRIKGV